MYRYNWHAIQDDGLVLTRWDAEGTEQKPDPWRTRQFHIFPTSDRRFPVVSVFIPKGMKFVYLKRKHIDNVSPGAGVDLSTLAPEVKDVIYIFGWVHPDEPSIACYTMLLPDGRIEQTNDLANHVTRYEKNIDVHGLTEYERMGFSTVLSLDGLREGEACQEIFVDCEIVDPYGPIDTALDALLDNVDMIAFGQSLGMLPE